jgi:hypothetical protein
MQNLCCAKDTVKRLERETIEQKKCTKHILEKRLISKTYGKVLK